MGHRKQILPNGTYFLNLYFGKCIHTVLGYWLFWIRLSSSESNSIKVGQSYYEISFIIYWLSGHLVTMILKWFADGGHNQTWFKTSSAWLFFIIIHSVLTNKPIDNCRWISENMVWTGFSWTNVLVSTLVDNREKKQNSVWNWQKYTEGLGTR